MRCCVAAALEGRTEFTGRLEEVTDRMLKVEEMPGRVRELPRSLVTKARLELDFPRRK